MLCFAVLCSLFRSRGFHALRPLVVNIKTIKCFVSREVRTRFKRVAPKSKPSRMLLFEKQRSILQCVLKTTATRPANPTCVPQTVRENCQRQACWSDPEKTYTTVVGLELETFPHCVLRANNVCVFDRLNLKTVFTFYFHFVLFGPKFEDNRHRCSMTFVCSEFVYLIHFILICLSRFNPKILYNVLYELKFV